MLTIALIMVLASISQCKAETCYCSCCTDNFCTPTLQGTIPVSSCDLSPCPSACQRKYPTKCINGAGSANYLCTSGSPPTPNWAGVFNMANRCDTRTCCCATGQLILSHVNTNTLRVQGQLTGLCPPGQSSIDQTIKMPDGFNAQILFLNNPIMVALSQDSRSIQFTDPSFPLCNNDATRSDALPTVTINLAFVSLLLGLISVKQFMM